MNKGTGLAAKPCPRRPSTRPSARYRIYGLLHARRELAWAGSASCPQRRCARYSTFPLILRRWPISAWGTWIASGMNPNWSGLAGSDGHPWKASSSKKPIRPGKSPEAFSPPLLTLGDFLRAELCDASDQLHGDGLGERETERALHHVGRDVVLECRDHGGSCGVD